MKVLPRFAEARELRFRETVKQQKEFEGRPHIYESPAKSFSRSNSGSFSRTVRWGSNRDRNIINFKIKPKKMKVKRNKSKEVHHIFYSKTEGHPSDMITIIRPNSLMQKKRSVQV